MKKIMIVMVVAFALGAIPALAQSPVRQAVKIPLEQVPVVVRQAYEKEFSTMSQEGYWLAFVESSAEGQRTSAKPLWYSYNSGKGKKERVEIKFSPTGEVTSVKGLASGQNVTEDKKGNRKDAKKISDHT